jgi:pimeloyl-ACP methyl ester carboxylesterase
MTRPETAIVDTGAAHLYVERRGTGPTLLVIHGGGMDASHFAEVATLLAEDFHTVTYDRRGYHRSPAPPDDTGTTVVEHADDAAALIRELGLAPVAVWGTSIGGVILLDLVHRYPELVRAAVVHEPVLFTLLDDEPAFRAGLTKMTEWARAEGPRAVMAEHAKAELGRAYTALDPAGRERLLANAEAFLCRDVPGLLRSLPAPDTLGGTVPTAVLRGAENEHTPPARAAAALAKWLDVPLETTPGGHVPHVTDPEATAATIRSALTRLNAD